MRALKRRLIYLPSVGVRTAIYKPVEDGSDYYTLSFIPEEARVSVEPTNWKVEDVEPFSVKNFLIRIENALTDNQHNLQPERPNAGFDRIHPTYQTRFQKWKNGMRKAKILERIPGSTEVQVKTVSVFSPMERKITQLKNPMENVHTLHLQPFQSKSSHSFRASKDYSKFEKMTSLEMHNYFNQKAADSLRKARATGKLGSDPGANPSIYGSEEIYGEECAENPDSEVYDTESEIEK